VKQEALILRTFIAVNCIRILMRRMTACGFIVILLLSAVAVMIVPVSVADSSPMGGQSCGDGVQWELSGGVLSITYTGSGTGMIDDFTPHTTPWENDIQNIVAVTIGDGVTSIGDMAFSDAVNLLSVSIAPSVESIGEFAFEACGSLKEVELPSGLEIIENGAFTSSGLEALEIPDRTVRIGINAFNHCEKLASVSIGSGVIDIGSSAFGGCTSLKSIDVSSDNNVLESVQGVLCKPDIGIVIECPAGWDMGNFVVPDGYVIIGDTAFEGCEGLTSVDLGATVKEIGPYGFMNCSNLQSVKWSPALTSIGVAAFHCCTSLKESIIPSTVTTMGELAFIGCDSLEEVEIPGSISRIEKFAFSGCGLKTVNIGEGVKFVGKSAFSGCNSLESISFPDSVETILDAVFDSSGSLRSISFGTGLESLHEHALTGIFAMEEINVAEGNSSYCSEDGILFNKEKTSLIYYPPSKSGRTYTVPSTVKTIQTLGFSNTKNLESITLPDGLEIIDFGSFIGCASLVTINIPKTVKSIGTNAFCYCKKLERFESSPLMDFISESMLYDCRSLKSVTISDSIVSIDDSALAGCDSLSRLYVGTSVKKICENAFTARFFIDGKEVEAIPENLVGKTWVGAGTDQCFYVLGSGYTITFDAGKGTSSSDLMTTVDGKLPALPQAVLAGKEFRGWLTDSGEIVNKETVFTSDTTLKASWEGDNPSSGSDMTIIVVVTVAIVTIMVIGAIKFLKRP